MRLVPDSVISTTTEDRFGEADTFDEALRIARSVARDGRAGDPSPSNIGAASSAS